jgi:hypothetical protein
MKHNVYRVIYVLYLAFFLSVTANYFSLPLDLDFLVQRLLRSFIITVPAAVLLLYVNKGLSRKNEEDEDRD